MARTAITPVKLVRDTAILMPVMAAVNGTSFQAEFTMTARDNDVIFLIENTNSGSTSYNVTIEGGNAEVFGETSTTSNDNTFAVAAGTTKAIIVNSAKYKNTSGDDMHKIIFTTTHIEVKVGILQIV